MFCTFRLFDGTRFDDCLGVSGVAADDLCFLWGGTTSASMFEACVLEALFAAAPRRVIFSFDDRQESKGKQCFPLPMTNNY
jgi:hypothetical protein